MLKNLNLKYLKKKEFKRSYLNGTDLSFVDEYFILCSSFFNGVWVKISTIASTSPIALCLPTIAKYNGYIKNMTKGKIRLLPTSYNKIAGGKRCPQS